MFINTKELNKYSAMRELLEDIRNVLPDCVELHKPVISHERGFELLFVRGELFLKVANSVTQTLNVDLPQPNYWTHMLTEQGEDRVLKSEYNENPTAMPVARLLLKNPKIRMKYGIGDC